MYVVEPSTTSPRQQFINRMGNLIATIYCASEAMYKPDLELGWRVRVHCMGDGAKFISYISAFPQPHERMNTTTISIYSPDQIFICSPE